MIIPAVALLLLAAGPSCAQDGLYHQVGRMLLVGTRGDAVRPGEDFERLVCGLKVGGVLLFDTEGDPQRTPRNIRSKGQLKRLTSDLQALARRCGNPPLLIAADLEGGSVNRMSPVRGLEDVPSHAQLGAGDPRQTLATARRIGRVMAETGVNWDLAPVVDLRLNPKNPVIGAWGRSFSSDPGEVALHAEAFARGLSENGILNCIKHFPGHGSSRQDSHRGAVDISETADSLQELWPFKELVRTGLADCVMAAHVYHREIDTERMVTVSPAALKDLLRRGLRFEGVALSDDMQMGALRDRYSLEEASVLAVNAGMDMLIVANSLGSYDASAAVRVHRALVEGVRKGRIPPSRIREANRRILELKSRLGGRR